MAEIDLEALAGNLSYSQRRCLAIFTMPEHRASDLGWATSNATVQMNAMNSVAPIITRRFNGGCNVYRLTELGRALRARLMEGEGE